MLPKPFQNPAVGRSRLPAVRRPSRYRGSAPADRSIGQLAGPNALPSDSVVGTAFAQELTDEADQIMRGSRPVPQRRAAVEPVRSPRGRPGMGEYASRSAARANRSLRRRPPAESSHSWTLRARSAELRAGSASALAARACAPRRPRPACSAVVDRQPPVPAGISRPTMTFSFRPLRVSTLPSTAASVSTRVVSWNEAAEMNELGLQATPW